MSKYAKNIKEFGEREAMGSSQLQPCRQNTKITCLLCCRLILQRIQPKVKEEEMKTKRNAIFKTLCDELHLCRDEIPDECLQEMFPFCKGCCEKVERLWEYNEEIKRIQEKKEATLLDIWRTVKKGEFFQPKIKNSTPLVVKAEAKKFKRLREVILEANPEAWRKDSRINDGLFDESSDRSEIIGSAKQYREPMLETTTNKVTPSGGLNHNAAPGTSSSIASRRSNSKGQNVTDKKSCVFCAKSFPTKGVLMQHLLTHTREKPFTCNVCYKEFGQKGNLTTHIRTHTGEKPFKCNLCFKTFNQKGDLGSHLRTHTRERPFKCILCFKTFNHKSNLGTHIKTHTGERPFKCNLCSKTFSQKGNLGSHLRTHIRK